MKTTAQIIKNQVNGIFVQSLIASKGWTEQQAADFILEFLTSGTRLSFGDFMNSK